MNVAMAEVVSFPRLILAHQVKWLLLLGPLAACAGWLPVHVQGEPKSDTRCDEVLDLSRSSVERQLTFSAHSHILTNTNVWSSDGEWIVYDIRPTPEQFSGTRIVRVNALTGEEECLYEAKEGAACAVATYHPKEEKVVFIQGPEPPTPDWSYGPSRRRGVMIERVGAGKPWVAHALDAQNYAPPFTPGALRGGTHLHVFSGDGQLVSFTYDDELLARLDEAGGADHEPNQRNVGVMSPMSPAEGPVMVNRAHPRNHDGERFTCLVTRTQKHPEPGSDEISRAFEEAWIGKDGYMRPDGERQKYALAFQGMVTESSGQQHGEVFVVDLPDDLRAMGDGPLEGTPTQRPSPPKGAAQRRLTFTGDRKYPGIQGVRHWLHSAPDGSQIAFLMKDDHGVAQLWLVSPNGGEPRQLSHYSQSVSSAFSWSPDGRFIAHAMNHHLFLTEVATGRGIKLTSYDPEGPLPYACVFSPDGRRIATLRKRSIPGGPGKQFSQVFVIEMPAL